MKILAQVAMMAVSLTLAFAPVPAEAMQRAGTFVTAVDSLVVDATPDLHSIGWFDFRRTVDFPTKYRKGDIIIKTGERRLYYVTERGRAIRYRVGVGRAGYEWSGISFVSRKAEWPGWTPPAAMRKLQPHLPAYMPGGPNNPLGARALYLGSTLYRIHGTRARSTIGRAVSSGCIRLLNSDVIDLYNRVTVGARVYVLQ